MIAVLRLSHRRERDKRITTHCGLTARAFGADRIIISGEKDGKTIESINNVASKWGGPFVAEYSSNWRKTVMEFKKKGFTIVHLTMYGLPFRSRIARLKRKNILVVVGSEKVPPDIYGLADHNISVGNQPHSEVAALGVFLYEVKGLKSRFSNAKMKISPTARGKRLIEL